MATTYSFPLHSSVLRRDGDRRARDYHFDESAIPETVTSVVWPHRVVFCFPTSRDDHDLPPNVLISNQPPLNPRGLDYLAVVIERTSTTTFAEGAPEREQLELLVAEYGTDEAYGTVDAVAYHIMGDLRAVEFVDPGLDRTIGLDKGIDRLPTDPS